MEADELVQPIVVSKNSTSTHEQVVSYVAHASCWALIKSFDDPIWKQWLSGRFTKSVRRATPGQIAKMPSPAFQVRKDQLIVAAFKPMTYDDMPKSIRNAQVSNTDFPRDEKKARRYPADSVIYHKDNTGGPTLWINEDLGMSTGKCAAQAAHGAMAMLCAVNQVDLNFWKENRIAFSVIGVNLDQFEKRCEDAMVVISDAGLTELEPGSATVAVS